MTQSPSSSSTRDRRSRRSVLAALAGGTAGVLSGCSALPLSTAPDPPSLDCVPSGDTWSTAGGGPTRTGSRDRQLPALSDPTGIVGQDVSVPGPMVASGDGLYVATIDGVRAYDPGGQLRWDYAFEEVYTSVGLVLGCGHLVVFTSNFGAILDPADGTVLWRNERITANAFHGNQTAAVRDGRLYQVGGVGLQAFDFEEGLVDLELQDFAGPVHGLSVGQSPVVATKRGIQAVDEAEGDVRWTFGSERSWWGPVIRDGVVYALAEDGHVAAVDASDGTERWTTSVRGSMGEMRVGVDGEGVENDVVYSRPAVGPDRVYVPPGNANTSVVVDRETGEEVYTVSTGLTHSPPLVGRDRVLFPGVNEGLVVVDRHSGDRLETLDWLPRRQPIYTDGTVYVPVRNGSPHPEVVAFS